MYSIDYPCESLFFLLLFHAPRPYRERLKKAYIYRNCMADSGLVPDVTGQDGSLESSLNY